MNGGRRPLTGIALAGLAIIAAVTFGLLRFYTASRNHLDEAMGQRLLAVAHSVALGTDPARAFALSLADVGQAAWADSLGQRYRAIARAVDLAEISLSDPEGRVLVSTSVNLPPGVYHDWWAVDREAVDKAVAGTGAASRLYRLQTVYQKSAHAPVILADPLIGEDVVVAVVTVSGSPDFFDALATLRNGALATGAVVLVVLVLGAAVLYRQALAVDRYRASMLRQESLAAMGRMTAGIAHEIRNPLGIIRGAGEHLQRVLDEAGVADDVVDFIPEEVDRLDRILSGYLSFGRGDPVADEVFDLDHALRRGAELLRGELAATGVELEVAADLPRTPVRGDPRRLQQVLLNLLLNARDAMPEGGTVALDLVVEGERARVRVRDRGNGLEGDPERWFEPFRTTKEKGSGLGLALSRQLVQEMGGRLTLANRKDGRGAVAEIELPAKNEPVTGTGA